MILMVFTALALVWIAIGSLLAWVAFREFHAPEKQPAREAWRRQHLDRYHADAQGDFLRSEIGMLWVFSIVMAFWPILLWRTWRQGGRTSG